MLRYQYYELGSARVLLVGTVADNEPKGLRHSFSTAFQFVGVLHHAVFGERPFARSNTAGYITYATQEHHSIVCRHTLDNA